VPLSPSEFAIDSQRILGDPRGSRSVMAAQDGSLSVFDVDWAVEAHIAAVMALLNAWPVWLPESADRVVRRAGYLILVDACPVAGRSRLRPPTIP